MITVPTIRCPKCGLKISITEAISAELRKSLKQELLQQTAQREASLRSELNEKLKIEKADLAAQIEEKAKLIGELRQNELGLRRQTRELNEREQARQLEIERTLDAERTKIADDITRRLTEENRLKAAEKEKQLETMRRQIEELKRRAEQGSQQMQGEVLELELEAELHNLFPLDALEPVAKGKKGGDLIQIVKLPSGQAGGAIMWETKRTKTWADDWISKAKDDQRSIGAECAVIVTQTMPRGHVRRADGTLKRRNQRRPVHVSHKHEI